MTSEALTVRVLLASPSDTAIERGVARGIISNWNATNAADEGVVLLPVGWETDAVPESGDHPQSIINRKLVDTSDILVGIFWTRLGTPTGDERSGTVAELERFIASGKPTLLYFCRKSVDPSSIDTEQLDAVRTFEAEYQKRGLYDTFGDEAEFVAKLTRALTRTVRDRFVRGSDEAEGLPQGHRLIEPPKPRQQALLGAHLENYGRKSHRLIVANTGTVDVHGVDVEVPEDIKRFSLDTSELPIEILRPGERIGLRAGMHFGSGRSIFDIHLTGITETGDTLRCPSKVSI